MAKALRFLFVPGVREFIHSPGTIYEVQDTNAYSLLPGSGNDWSVDEADIIPCNLTDKTAVLFMVGRFCQKLPQRLIHDYFLNHPYILNHIHLLFFVFLVNEHSH